MKSILPLILLLLSGISSTAGNLSVTFDLSGNPGSEDINITLRPAEDYNPASSVTLARSGTQRTGEIPASPSGLYYLYCYTPQYQTSIPVSLDASSFTAPVKVNVDAGDFVVSTSLAGASPPMPMPSFPQPSSLHPLRSSYACGHTPSHPTPIAWLSTCAHAPTSRSPSLYPTSFPLRLQSLTPLWRQDSPQPWEP